MMGPHYYFVPIPWALSDIPYRWIERYLQNISELQARVAIGLLGAGKLEDITFVRNAVIDFNKQYPENNVMEDENGIRTA